MPTIEDDVWIDAPVDEVFECLAPGNHVDVVPSPVEGTEEGDLPDGCTRVGVRNESDPPGPEFVGKSTDPLLARYLTREIDYTLQNVKMIVEET